MTSISVGILVALGMSGLPVTLWAQDYSCGDLENAYGPFDYRTATSDQRRLVENAHFSPKVETLRGGSTSVGPGGDIDYTLRVFPNHARALMAMMKLAKKEKTERPRGSSYSIACWFDRAERFRPDDVTVKSVTAMNLVRHGKKSEAIAKLDEAVALGVQSVNDEYSIGLTYFEAGQYDKALSLAHRAYAGGFPLPGLRNKLKRAGKWRDSP